MFRVDRGEPRSQIDYLVRDLRRLSLGGGGWGGGGGETY